MEQLEGIVTEIIFQNEENGFAVASLAMGVREETIVGVLPFLREGERVRISGEWTQHPTFGKQLKAESYEVVLPKREDEIERYLASGIVKGVGPATAKAIVRAFGADTLEVLSMNPERLGQVEGVGPKRAQQIAKSYAQQHEMRDVMLFLQRYQIPPGYAMRIVRAYGGEAVRVLKENPYRLVQDVRGIGFRIADRIALSMGVAPEHPNRLRAGLLYTLWEAANAAGHVYLPREELLDSASGVLKADREEVANQLTGLALERQVVQEEGEEDVAVYHALLHAAEVEVAYRLKLLLEADMERFEEVGDAQLDRFEAAQGIAFETGQRQAILSALKEGVVVVTGGPGTGKTTVINCIISLLQRMGLTVSLAAPTGRAAKRMTEATGQEAKTLHRLLEFAQSKGEEGVFNRDADDPLKADAVIVDEMSMVDLLLMRSLLRALAPGTRLIMVGDADQLPSVGAGNVLHDIIASKAVPVARLTQVFRQAAQSQIVLNAHRINAGQMPELRNHDTDFYFERKGALNQIADSVIQLCVRRLPAFFELDPMRDIQVLAPMKKGEAGVRALNARLQAQLNPPSRYKKERHLGEGLLREGDKVMQVRNNYQAEWSRGGEGEEEGLGVFNGDLGAVECIEDNEVTVVFDDERRVVYDEAMVQDLELAYAMTIHKSQGSEFDTVVLALPPGPPRMMVRNLLYTAVTRAKRRVVLVGQEATLARMVASDRAARRYSQLAGRLIQMGSMGNES